MKLEQQVCDLKYAKKLKELGVKQESLWYWKLSGTKFILVDKFYLFDKNLHGDSRVYSAFTTAELGEMLPHFLEIKGIRYQLFESVALGEMDNNKSKRQWFVVYANEEDYSDNAPIKFMMCWNEANARAKMLIYLIENNLTTP